MHDLSENNSKDFQPPNLHVWYQAWDQAGRELGVQVTYPTHATVMSLRSLICSLFCHWS